MKSFIALVLTLLGLAAAITGGMILVDIQPTEEHFKEFRLMGWGITLIGVSVVVAGFYVFFNPKNGNGNGH